MPSFDELVDRVAALEQGPSLQQLPLNALKTFLESDWQPDSGLLLQPASITTDLLAAASVGASQIANNAVGPTQVATTIPTAVEALRIVRGSVSGAGVILAGVGFSVSRTGAGLYNVTFTAAFSALPTVVTGLNSSAASVDTEADSITTTSFRGVVFSAPGVSVDEPWGFIAAGPR